MKYTAKDLEKVGRLYDLNAEAMIEASKNGNKKLHALYKKRERQLNNLDIKIRKELGVFMYGRRRA